MERLNTLESIGGWIAMAAFTVFSAMVVDTALAATSITGTKHNLGTTGTGSNHLTAGTDEVCVFCHTPHGGSDGSLLVETNRMTLCMGCHDDAPQMHFHPMGDKVKNPDNKGKIVCTSCHSPHNSSQKALLLGDPVRGLCVRCHDPSASHGGG